MNHEINAVEKPSPASPNLQQRAMAILQKALIEEKVWVKVHAAEALVTLDDRKEVRKIFDAECAQASDQPRYRIGIWRVLAQAEDDPARRDRWIESIVQAFMRTDGPDRAHAAEALGKLGYVPRNDAEKARFAEDANSKNASLAGFACWVLSNSGRPEDLAALSKRLQSPNEDDRVNAAYALRFKKQASHEIGQELAEAALQEPSRSSGRVYLLSAAFVHAVNASEANMLKNELLPYAKQGNKDEKTELAAALAVRGNETDLPLLTAMLDDPEPDLRVIAAQAILCIGRRSRP